VSMLRQQLADAKADWQKQVEMLEAKLAEAEREKKELEREAEALRKQAAAIHESATAIENAAALQAADATADAAEASTEPRPQSAQSKPGAAHLDLLAAEVARLASAGGRVYDILLKWDANHSGSLDAREFGAIFKSLNIKASSAEVKATMALIDKDGSGSVSMQELYKAVTKRLSDSERAQGVSERKKVDAIDAYSETSSSAPAKQTSQRKSTTGVATTSASAPKVAVAQTPIETKTNRRPSVATSAAQAGTSESAQNQIEMLAAEKASLEGKLESALKAQRNAESQATALERTIADASADWQRRLEELEAKLTEAERAKELAERESEALRKLDQQAKDRSAVEAATVHGKQESTDSTAKEQRDAQLQV